jgi:hypothetical protein
VTIATEELPTGNDTAAPVLMPDTEKQLHALIKVGQRITEQRDAAWGACRLALLALAAAHARLKVFRRELRLAVAMSAALAADVVCAETRLAEERVRADKAEALGARCKPSWTGPRPGCGSWMRCSLRSRRRRSPCRRRRRPRPSGRPCRCP